MNLSNLKPAAGSVKNAGKRVGRGQGSGKGGTATRGHKGAKSRSGYSRKIGFEGGQMPLHLVKILGRGELKASLKITVHKFTATAKAAIEKAGGEAVTL